MKKLLFIASVGLLFSCKKETPAPVSDSGTCACTWTGPTGSGTYYNYYGENASQYCADDEAQNQSTYAALGMTYNCVLE